MPNLDKDFYLDKQGLRQLVNELETNIVASEYDTSVSYVVGQYCIYENNFYRCTTATTGAWDSTAWIKVVISDEIPTIHSITMAQWEALTPAQKASGDYVITDATTVPLTAENVPYDDTVSGLTADNVQDAIDEVHSQLSSIIDVIYPVGSIYLSVTDSTVASVQARFGGTWVAFGSGKTLVGVDGNDSDFDTVEETGGSKSESYTPTGSNAAVTLTAAQSGVPAHSHGMTQPAFTVNSSGSCTITSSGGHSHNVSVNDGTTTANLRINNAWMTWTDSLLASGTNKSGFDGGTARPGYVTIPKLTGATTSNGAHTHSVPNHTHTLTRSTDAAVSNNTAAKASASHNHTFTGTAATINHVQPYITVYMYKRTA